MYLCFGRQKHAKCMSRYTVHSLLDIMYAICTLYIPGTLFFGFANNIRMYDTYSYKVRLLRISYNYIHTCSCTKQYNGGLLKSYVFAKGFWHYYNRINQSFFTLQKCKNVGMKGTVSGEPRWLMLYGNRQLFEKIYKYYWCSFRYRNIFNIYFKTTIEHYEELHVEIYIFLYI